MNERIIDMNFNKELDDNKGYEQELDDNTLRKLVDHSNTIKSLWKSEDKILKGQWFFSNIGHISDGKKKETWRELEIYKALKEIEKIILNMNIDNEDKVKSFFKILMSI
jgi:hypothetical protein